MIIRYSMKRILAIFEQRRLRRSVGFKIFCVLAVVIIAFYLFFFYTPFIPIMEVWEQVALPSFIPFFFVSMLTMLQTIALIFLGDLSPTKRVDSFDVIRMKPYTNLDYIVGKAWGTVSLFLRADIVICTLIMLVHVLLTDSPFNPLYYIYALLFITLPSLVFITGLSFLLQTMIRQRAISSLLVLAVVAVLYQFGMKAFGCTDLFINFIPTAFSEMVGLRVWKQLLLHRFFFFLVGCAFLMFAAVCMRRLCEVKKRPLSYSATGAVFLVAGCLALFFYWDAFQQRLKARQTYRESYILASQYLHPRMTSQQLAVELKQGKMHAVSEVTLVNQHDTSLSRVTLYLNPGWQ